MSAPHVSKAKFLRIVKSLQPCEGGLQRLKVELRRKGSTVRSVLEAGREAYRAKYIRFDDWVGATGSDYNWLVQRLRERRRAHEFHWNDVDGLLYAMAVHL